jgi:hypothetical protein
LSSDESPGKYSLIARLAGLWVPMIAEPRRLAVAEPATKGPRTEFANHFKYIQNEDVAGIIQGDLRE